MFIHIGENYYEVSSISAIKAVSGGYQPYISALLQLAGGHEIGISYGERDMIVSALLENGMIVETKVKPQQ